MDPSVKNPGTVYLVGAGPGDPGLMTVKGMRFLESADVVVHDRLLDERLLSRAPRGAEVIDVGKAPGERLNPQSKINALLVARAREGKRVVRLKGGDPFVFGRGGEEALALAEAGVRFEVVPGVTSAIAAPAYAGIPPTHRDFASSITIVTGTEGPDKADSAVAWDKLAQVGGTLVVLMAWESLESIAAALIRGGRPAETPVAVVQWATEPYQRTVVGTLSDIAEKARRAGLAPPTVAVIGEVVKLRDSLRWFDNRPLFGKRVLVTRSRYQAGALSELLYREGAHPLELPTIEVQPLQDYTALDEALRSLSGYDWVVFTSTNTVQVVFDRLAEMGRDARALQSVRVAAIGQSTAASLKEHGVLFPDLVPEEFISESVVDGLKKMGVSGGKVLLPRAEMGRETLREGLEAAGSDVHEITAYRTVMPEDAPARIDRVLADGIDVATFTSSSTVRNLSTLLKGNLNRLGEATIACIGPITAAAARDAGLRVDIVAGEYTLAGLVDGLKAYFSTEDFSDE
jgi:uroporphyrinogen III methyltransferase/synthase